jgi:N-acetylglucosamine-6-phosphate deacetylase
VDLLVTASSVHGISDSPGRGWIHVVDGQIAASGHGEPPRGADLHHDGILAPGLIDAQINGAYGADFAAADDADWARIVSTLPETGVTAIVPTFITAPIEQDVADLHAYAERLTTSEAGTRLLPCHVEGPFLAPTRRGAHREDLLIDPTPERVQALIDAGGDALGYVTLAPEREGAMAAIKTFTAAGVRVAVGHSDASATTVNAAVDAGATLVTHLFNAQSPLLPREPGVVGAGLANPGLTLGLIADLYHVNAEAIRLTFAAAPGRVMLVTDNVSAFGMPPGEYELGGQIVTITEGDPARREDGTIAGAASRLDTCVANTVACGIPLEDAISAVTSVPAGVLGHHQLGHLRPGAAADFVLLGADDLRTQQTWIRGVQAFDRGRLTVRD